MTNEQLQERCLEFAGFTREPDSGKHQFWYRPGDELIVLYPEPDFLASVDAHVKWTLPKLREWRGKNGLIADYYSSNWLADSGDKCFSLFLVPDDAVRTYTPDESVHIECEGESEAMNICKAIWELTEKDNEL